MQVTLGCASIHIGSRARAPGAATYLLMSKVSRLLLIAAEIQVAVAGSSQSLHAASFLLLLLEAAFW